jgi:hypothetical protein
MQMPLRAQGRQTARRRSAKFRRDQMRRVQRSDNGEARGGDRTVLSIPGTRRAGSAATGECAGSNAICRGATICAEDSPNAGMGAWRWQQGARGSFDCECCSGPAAPAPWFIIVQCEQWDLAVEVATLQSASPSAGAISTAKSSPEAISLRHCMLCLYTSFQQSCVFQSQADVRSWVPKAAYTVPASTYAIDSVLYRACRRYPCVLIVRADLPHAVDLPQPVHQQANVPFADGS